MTPLLPPPHTIFPRNSSRKFETPFEITHILSAKFLSAPCKDIEWKSLWFTIFIALFPGSPLAGEPGNEATFCMINASNHTVTLIL